MHTRRVVNEWETHYKCVHAFRLTLEPLKVAISDLEALNLRQYFTVLSLTETRIKFVTDEVAH